MSLLIRVPVLVDCRGVGASAIPSEQPMVAKSHEFEVVLQSEPEGGFSVSVPALAGCHTQGETRDEALAMAKDAIEGYLEARSESAFR